MNDDDHDDIDLIDDSVGDDSIDDVPDDPDDDPDDDGLPPIFEDEPVVEETVTDGDMVAAVAELRATIATMRTRMDKMEVWIASLIDIVAETGHLKLWRRKVKANALDLNIDMDETR